eukprot:7657818-Pyramimonas_sp.AAC.1
MGRSATHPRPILTCAAHGIIVDARGWGAPPWTHKCFLHVQRAGCPWRLADEVPSHKPISDSH